MQAMNEIGVTGITITNVLGCGVQKGAPSYYRGVEMEMNLLPKIKIEIVVSLVPISLVLGFIVSFWSEIIIDYIILPAVIVGLGFILYGQFKYNKGIF